MKNICIFPSLVPEVKNTLIMNVFSTNPTLFHNITP